MILTRAFVFLYIFLFSFISVLVILVRTFWFILFQVAAKATFLIYKIFKIFLRFHRQGLS